jgi:hypothetical protein
LRPAGWLLLIAGCVLCLNVAWAALGFLLMGVGLVALLAAEAKRSRPAVAIETVVESEYPATEIIPAPLSPPPPTRVEPPPPQIPGPRWAPAPLSDEDRWRILLATDADVARLAAALAPYGQKYVDHLAAAYLGEADPARLPEIIDRIVAAARNDARMNGKADVTPTHDRVVPPDAEAVPRLSTKRRLLDSLIPADDPAAPASEELQNSDNLTGADADGRGSTIVAADEDLTGLLGSFSPNFDAPKRA